MSPVITRKHGWRVATLVVVCLIFACIPFTRIVQAYHLNYKVKIMTAQLNDLKMKTMCAGRFLIDVPADADVSYRGAMIAGWSIATYDNETDEQFAARVEKKETQLAEGKNERGMPQLERTHRVDENGVHGKIHVFGREWIRGLPNEPLSESVKVEAMIRVKNHSFNLTRKFGNDGYLKTLSELVAQFRAREADEIPTEAGFCFDGGFITEPLTVKQTERTTMFVGLTGHPDVSIMLDMTAGITTPKTLLQRDAEAAIGDENRSRFHTFRRGPRPFNGEAGEEVLERVHEFNGNYGHSFMWELAHNKTDNVFTPLMSFEMTTGHGRPGTTVDSSLTDAHALALWDRMLSSLRVRPVVAAKPVAAAPAPAEVPPGAWAHANEPCPQTGWWECVDVDENIAIVGGRKQYYRKGEGMSQAVQLLPATPWQRLSGQQPTFTSKTPTSWKLVSRRQHPRSATAATALHQPAMPVDSGAKPHESDVQFSTSVMPGTMADSGMACPASGWWRCADALALDSTRWFGRGEKMPLAKVRASLSALKRLTETSSTSSQTTTWIFLRHDEGANAGKGHEPESGSTDTPT